MSSNLKTRQASGEKFGGAPTDLPVGHLPSYGDIASYFYKTQADKNLNYPAAVDKICEDLVVKWQIVNRSLPLVENKYLRNKVKAFLDKVKFYDQRKKLTKAQRQNMEQEKDFLFDIAACKCSLPELPCNARYLEFIMIKQPSPIYLNFLDKENQIRI